MSGHNFWNTAIKKADATSPKTGALKRLDRLRGALGRLDPVEANRAWKDLAAAIDAITNRYSK
ncbi:hypothetical protein [Streptomyces sp. SM12]|uniref:hypothetical protein n=1 Tax=Streptomyces sp. SM12 TaxID=1071602 RepID=UPI000CD5C602|nr:hypothetical protein [Streptomyces sp. SM12]